MEVEAICISKILMPKQSKDQEVQHKDKVDKDVINERECSKADVPAKKRKTRGRPSCGSTQNDMEIWKKLKSGQNITRTPLQEKKLQNFKTSKHCVNVLNVK